MTGQMREPLSLKLLAVLGVAAAFHFAKVILMPLAMAVLLTFVLAPRRSNEIGTVLFRSSCKSVWLVFSPGFSFCLGYAESERRMTKSCESGIRAFGTIKLAAGIYDLSPSEMATIANFTANGLDCFRPDGYMLTQAAFWVQLSVRLRAAEGVRHDGTRVRRLCAECSDGGLVTNF